MTKAPAFHTYEEFLEFCLNNRKIGLAILNKTRRYTPFVFGDIEKSKDDPNIKICMCAGYRVIEDLNKLLKPRTTGNYKKWRTAVLIRDNFSCTECGSKINPHVHHIQKLSEVPSLSMDIDNGMTLCSTCHRKVHAAR